VKLSALAGKIGESIQGSHLQGFGIENLKEFIGDNFIF
jgi:hypothetical protein